MNKLLLSGFLASALLAGCALAPEYDNNEYELLARLETTVTMINENCSDAEIVKSYIPTLEYDARLLHTYSFYIPQNSDTYTIVDILKEDIVQFKERYDNGSATPTYCTLKTQIFLGKVRTALDAVGSKARI